MLISQCFLLLTLVYPQIMSIDSASACTEYAQVDLYIVLDVGGYVPVNIAKRSFEFVRGLVSTVDLRNTRIAFWTGDECDYGAKGPNISCSAADKFRFDFSGYSHLSTPEQKRRQIVQSVYAIEQTVTTDNFIAGQKQQTGSAIFVGATWLNELRWLKRPDAELATLGILYAKLDENGKMAAIDGPIDNDTGALQLFILQNFENLKGLRDVNMDDVYQLGQQQNAAQPVELLNAMCKQLTNCHYVYDKQAICRWDENGTCQRNITGNLKIFKKASGSGKPCPPNSGTVLCDLAICEKTCDINDASQWDLWSECDITCGGTGRRFRMRDVHPRLPSITCSTVDFEKCPVLKPCPIPGESVATAKWHFIVIGLAVTGTLFVVITSCYLLTHGFDHIAPAKSALSPRSLDDPYSKLSISRQRKRMASSDRKQSSAPSSAESETKHGAAKVQYLLTFPMSSTRQIKSEKILSDTLDKNTFATDRRSSIFRSRSSSSANPKIAPPQVTKKLASSKKQWTMQHIHGNLTLPLPDNSTETTAEAFSKLT